MTGRKVNNLPHEHGVFTYRFLAMLWDQETILISHPSSLRALYTMPVKLISEALHWASVAFKHCLANLSGEAAGSGNLDSLVVGVAL